MDRARGRQSAWSGMSALPTPTRWAIVAAIGLGVTGGVVGLVLGLDANPPTAWFAVLEIGVPAGIVGAVVGFAAGGVAWCVGRLRTGHGTA